MPVYQGIKNGKPYYSWGTTGKKYYYNTALGKRKAYEKARRQGIAISISQIKNKQKKYKRTIKKNS